MEAKKGGKRGESGYIFWQSGLHVLIEGGNGILQHPCLLTDQTDEGGMRRMQEQITTRICEWCAESIPASALRCPRCQKWRKDIENDINITRTFAITAASLLTFIAIAMISPNGIGGVIEKELRFVEVGRVETIFGSLPKTELRPYIHITPVGFFFIAVSIVSLALSTYYYIKASRKMGIWWWF